MDPSEDQAKEVQYGVCAFFPTGGNSGLSSSTVVLLSKSQILMEFWVAAHNQYLLGEKHKLWMMSPASRE